MKNELIKIINDKSATIGIIGLGYVGLPALIRLSKKFDAHGVDINKSRIET